MPAKIDAASRRLLLLCGSCGHVICKGVSAESCTSKFSAPVQLLVKCPKCGTHNRLPAKVGE